VARFNGTNNKTIQASLVTIGDTGEVLIPNNVAYAAKNTSGSSVACAWIDSSDLVKFGPSSYTVHVGNSATALYLGDSASAIYIYTGSASQQVTKSTGTTADTGYRCLQVPA
jgi:hypothetical protein